MMAAKRGAPVNFFASVGGDGVRGKRKRCWRTSASSAAEPKLGSTVVAKRRTKLCYIYAVGRYVRKAAAEAVVEAAVGAEAAVPFVVGVWRIVIFEVTAMEV